MTMKPTTLITGAGRRIGAEIARHLAAQGHNLVLHYHRSRNEAEVLANEIRATHHAPRVALIKADLEDTPTLEKFWNGLPPVTQIIHNASRYVRDTLDTMTAADLRAHLAVNLEAPILLTQGFSRQLPKDRSGNIIFIGDDALRWSISPEFFSYAASKHAGRAVIDLVAGAVAPRIRANIIALAPTLPGTNDPDGLFERLAERAPLKRTGEVHDVLTAIDYLSTAPGITGQVIGLGNGMGLNSFRAQTQ